MGGKYYMEQSQNEGKGVKAEPGSSANQKNKKKMSKAKAIGILAVIVIIWLIAVQLMAADRYQAVVKVVEGENQVGVNPLTDRLDYGDLSRDNGASRFVSLKNDGRVGKFIMVWKFGEISEIMKLSNNNFTLKPGEEYRLELNVYIPVSAEIREYKGRVWIFKWPKPF